jgi:hypothetical protein
MAPAIVHCLAAPVPALAQENNAKSAGTKKGLAEKHPPLKIHYGSEGLPAPLEEMREAILSAVRVGRIEELRHAYELNELKPDLGGVPVSDPIAHWRKISGDGEGREVLAALAEILETGYVELPLGRDLENNRVYVWPYLAEVPLDKLSPGQEVELLRLVPPAAAKEMKKNRRYAHWRIAIGADGTWHSFRKEP